MTVCVITEFSKSNKLAVSVIWDVKHYICTAVKIPSVVSARRYTYACLRMCVNIETLLCNHCRFHVSVVA